MPTVPTSTLSNLQKNPKNIRNICLIAHVDHGKTTLSDSLISSNGIISSRLAGTIQYLDYRQDEQERGITMKSSSISLLYKSRTDDYLINLIDSPGHIDFSAEVSTAVRQSDGAVLLVDVVEGVCIQTIEVLRAAWREKLQITLVLNKMDRLYTQLHLTPTDAFQKITQVVEEVNAVIGLLSSEEWWTKEIESAHQKVTEIKEKVSQESSKENEPEVVDVEQDEEKCEDYFSPTKGNVVFASSVHGWAFNIKLFCEMYANKLGIRREVLQKFLWGNYFFNPKTKQIFRKNVSGRMVPMFAQFVLQNIWQVYSAAYEDPSKVEKIVNALGLKIPARELSHKDPKATVEAIFSRWLPLAPVVLNMVVNHLPSPPESQAIRVSKLWQPPSLGSEELLKKYSQIREQMMTCDPTGEVVVFVSKVISVPADAIVNVRYPRRGPASEGQTPPPPVPEVPKDEERFIAFARIFSGTIRVGQKLQILGPRYNPLESSKHRKEFQVSELFLLMGRSLERVTEVPAGNVFGIGNVEDKILKTATISSTEEITGFSVMTYASSPIVRVAVEPESPLQMTQLVEGLKLLNQADPSVEILVQETGEHVIVASGELHLELCLRDLKEKFAKIDFRVSPPIVAFRESVTADPSLKYPPTPPPVSTANKLGRLQVTAIPLPENIRSFLTNTSHLIRQIFVDRSVSLDDDSDAANFRTQLEQEFHKAGEFWEKQLRYLWAFGPRRVGANLLLNHIPGYSTSEAWKSLTKEMFSETQSAGPAPNLDADSSSFKDDDDESIKSLESVSLEKKIRLLSDLDNSIVTGFQMATNAGPLCEEPMAGVCFIVEDVQLLESAENKIDSRGPFSGQIISAMREACRQAFLSRSVRLMEAVYLCDIQIPMDSMGKMYAVLGRRRAKIIREEVKEGTYIYITQALLPVVESFGLSKEILTETSGAASVQLMFSHWQVLDKDPFFVASTEEELEEIGENLGGVAPNLARNLIDSVRRRKGLRVEEKLVQRGEKQRTLGRNK